MKYFEDIELGVTLVSGGRVFVLGGSGDGGNAVSYMDIYTPPG